MDRFRGQYTIDDLAVQAADQRLAPTGVDTLRAARHDLVAGGIGQQPVEPAVHRHLHIAVVVEIVDARDLDHQAVVAVLGDRLVLEDVFHTIRTTEADDAAQCPVELIIDPLLTVRMREIVRPHLAIQVQAIGERTARLVEGEGVGVGCRQPGLDLLFQLRVDDGALATLGRKQHGVLLARTVVVALRTFGLAVRSLVDGPIEICQDITDRSVPRGRRGGLRPARIRIREPERSAQRNSHEPCEARHNVPPK